LIASMPRSNAAYLIGDNAYDSNHLYEKTAEKNCQLLAPQRTLFFLLYFLLSTAPLSRAAPPR
ncbi:MAG: hypothetical protein ABSC42_16195, partial [Tepidisphaeraceae bacterium]